MSLTLMSVCSIHEHTYCGSIAEGIRLSLLCFIETWPQPDHDLHSTHKRKPLIAYVSLLPPKSNQVRVTMQTR